MIKEVYDPVTCKIRYYDTKTCKEVVNTELPSLPKIKESIQILQSSVIEVMSMLEDYFNANSEVSLKLSEIKSNILKNRL